MAKFAVDPVAHAAATNKMGDALEGTRATVQRLQASVDAVLAGWKGGASDAMVAAHARFHQTAGQCNTHIDHCHGVLHTSLTSAVDAEQSNAQPFTNLV